MTRLKVVQSGSESTQREPLRQPRWRDDIRFSLTMFRLIFRFLLVNVAARYASRFVASRMNQNRTAARR